MTCRRRWFKHSDCGGGLRARKGQVVTELVITASIAAGLFSGAIFLAYDLYSTIVWRRQFAAQDEPVRAEPTPDPVVDHLPAPAAEALSP